MKENRIISGKLLSPDGQLTLIVVALDPEVARTSQLADTVEEIKKTTALNLQGTGLSAQLAGAPVMQLEIRNAVQGFWSYQLAGLEGLRAWASGPR